jgi:hypothetical protein
MGDVISINARRCGRCGAEGSRRELEYQGEKVGDFGACDACVEKTEAELDAVRPVFDAMIAAGIDREIANDIMTFLLDRLHPKKEG